MTHVRMWKFRPPPNRVADFNRHYAGPGRWAKLFAKAPGYLGTDLLYPTEPEGWYLTIDRWQSAKDFDGFLQRFGDEYRALDRELVGISGEDEFVGAFEEEPAIESL